MSLEFLNHFLPHWEESTDEYLIPQYADNPIKEFQKAEDVMSYLELHKQDYQSMYWSNFDADNPNAHGMLFYTEDGYMIFGISRDSKEVDPLKKPIECLEEMKKFFNTDEGYITH